MSHNALFHQAADSLLPHGGRTRSASDRFAIPLEDWLDLSTGINPQGWPVPSIPPTVWATLPEDGDGLEASAASYYGSSEFIAVAGSQAAIQTLPWLRPSCQVAVLTPSYNEHAHAWQKAGHVVTTLPVDALPADLAAFDVLVLVNPNNPTGTRWQSEQLVQWHDQLAARGGWLIVDEAYLDPRPELSMIARGPLPGLIVLRSVGKFFGLAGLRVGFMFAESMLRQRMCERLGPWSVAHPSRWVATQALNDPLWQRQTRTRLTAQASRLAALLTQHGWMPSGGCELFQWLRTESAPLLYEQLARQGILVRLFEKPAGLRFGSPGAESDWARLNSALNNLQG